MLFSVLLLAIAVSFDSLAIGITYGLNRISIPLWSKLILSAVSGCSLAVTMWFGALLEQRISPNFSTALGGLIFIFLGLYNLWRSYRSAEEQVLINWHIPILGLFIQVSREPLSADSDHSQHIAGVEALVLGGALALDAGAAGFGAAILGLPTGVTTLMVMLANYIFITQGLQIGARFDQRPEHSPDLRWIPGMIICTIGLVKFFF